MQLRDNAEKFTERNVGIILIGMGTVDQAAHFKTRMRLQFPLLVDNKRRSYAAVELTRGSVADVTGPRVWAEGIKSLAKGRGIARPRQDPFQLGGAAVFDRGGELLYVHRAQKSSDIAPINRLLQALP